MGRGAAVKALRGEEERQGILPAEGGAAWAARRLLSSGDVEPSSSGEDDDEGCGICPSPPVNQPHHHHHIDTIDTRQYARTPVRRVGEFW
jgi:hypothetical protein